MKKVKIFKMVNTIILLLILGNSTALAAEISQKENLTEPKQEKNNDKNLNILKSQKKAKEKIDKVKIFKMVSTTILLLIMSGSTTLAKKITQRTKKENSIESTKQEKNNDKNLNISKSQEEAEEKIDSEEYEIENFKIENIYQKGETIFVSYEHIKSGAKFVVWFENLNSKAMNHLSFKDPTMFFKCIPTNNLGVAHALEHFLATPIWEKLKNNLTLYERKTIHGNSDLGETSKFFYNDGFGFKFNIKKWSPQVVKIVTDELKDPTFLKDNKQLFSVEKKRMILELKEEQVGKVKKLEKDFESYDRFIGGKFFATGLLKDAEKLSFETAKKAFEENIIPENMLIQISARLNPDYKQIMKSFDERYLKNYVKKNSFKKDKQKLKTNIETEPVRQLNLDYIEYLDYDSSKNNQKFKNKAKLYWEIENLSPKEKEIFNMIFFKNPIIMQLKNEIKNLGYEIAIINNEIELGIFGIFNPTQFDNLFCLDLYGNDPSKFEEKTLKENAKKILNMIYEKIKNFENSELLKTNLVSHQYVAYSTNNYRDENFNSLMNKSFALTNKPINEKFFDIEGQNIKDDYLNKRVLENLKKYKDNFKKIINLSPTYIDIYTAKKTKDDGKLITENETKLERYQNPITFKSSNKILKEWAENLTEDLFLIPNINDKGLSYSYKYFPYIESLNTEIKKIEEYLCNKFIKDFKNFKPTREQFKKLNEKWKKNNKLSIDEIENEIKDLNKSLKNPKILKKLAIIEQQASLNLEFKIKDYLKELEETLKNEENIEDVKKMIEQKKTYLKEITENKDNIVYYINKSKEIINNEIKSLKSVLASVKKIDDLRSKITYEDFINIFKNAKIETKSHLEKYKPKKHENNLK